VRAAVLPALLDNARIGDGSYDALKLGGILPVSSPSTFEKADYPGLRAIRIGDTITLADALPDSHPINPTPGAAWTTWVPSYTGLTPGAGAVTIARYIQDGSVVHFYWEITLGTAPTVGSTLVTLPVSAAATYRPQSVIGNMALFDASVPSTTAGLTRTETATQFLPVVINTGTHIHNNVTTTVPFTWAVGDRMIGTGTYEAATPATTTAYLELLY
jgi:hypothetical protein